MPSALHIAPFCSKMILTGGLKQREMNRYVVTMHSAAEKHGIEWGYPYIAEGAPPILIEPTFFWSEPNYEVDCGHIEPAHDAKSNKTPANLEARQPMAGVRKDLAQLYVHLGTARLQIGKKYPFRESPEPLTYALLQAITTNFDPKGLMNSGSLGHY